jgi:hypothetical protein
MASLQPANRETANRETVIPAQAETQVFLA